MFVSAGTENTSSAVEKLSGNTKERLLRVA